MYIILTYDIEAKRTSKALKISRRYLRHVQKSVFEGDITESKLKKLKWELERIIIPETDQIAIYRIDTMRSLQKEVIGYSIVTDNVI